MNVLSNLHTHTLYCDGKSTALEVVLSAISKGFEVIGFSGHSYTAFDESYCMSREDTMKYRDEIHSLAKQYEDKITVLCGIEQDFFSWEPTDEYDYVIHSVHAFFKEAPETSVSLNHSLPDGIIAADGGFYVYVDYTRDAIVWAIANLYDGDSLALAEDYFRAVASLEPKIRCDISHRPVIVGHFDLLTKFDESGSPLFDQSAQRYRDAASEALHALLPTGAVFEINTGAMSKGYRTAPYPAPFILKEIQKSGGKIILSSDSHHADTIDFAFSDALELAKECGF